MRKYYTWLAKKKKIEQESKTKSTSDTTDSTRQKREDLKLGKEPIKYKQAFIRPVPERYHLNYFMGTPWMKKWEDLEDMDQETRIQMTNELDEVIPMLKLIRKQNVSLFSVLIHYNTSKRT